MQTYFCYKVASKWGNIRWKTQVNLLKDEIWSETFVTKPGTKNWKRFCLLAKYACRFLSDLLLQMEAYQPEIHNKVHPDSISQPFINI
jgi:hypothetical protein